MYTRRWYDQHEVLDTTWYCLFVYNDLFQYVLFWWRIMTLTDIALYSGWSGSSQGIPKRQEFLETYLDLLCLDTGCCTQICPKSWLPFPVGQEKLSSRIAGQWMGKSSDWDFGAGQQELTELHYEPRQPNGAVGNELQQDPRVYWKRRVDIASKRTSDHYILSPRECTC